MARSLLVSGCVAGLLCGCASTSGTDRCDDCLPPKSSAWGYTAWYDNLVTKDTAKKCAKDALDKLDDDADLSKHFEDGFQQAYVDLAFGRRAVTPPVPPKGYWNAFYRSCAGADDVADWFAGYRMGLEIGSQSGVARFNRVATSWRGGPGCPVDGAPTAAPFAPEYAAQRPQPTMAGSVPASQLAWGHSLPSAAAPAIGNDARAQGGWSRPPTLSAAPSTPPHATVDPYRPYRAVVPVSETDAALPPPR